MKKKELLKEIKDEVLSLTTSPLYEYRKENGSFPVIGEGDHDAKLMFIGEAPGAEEAKRGRPFCGTAGRLLDWCLQEIGFDRADAYITNIVKDRPPRNRDPSSEEIEIYVPFLDRQIEIIKPQIIAPLGRFSAIYIMAKFGFEKEILPITKMHGKVFFVDGLKIIPLLHPAAAIHNPHQKDLLLQGFKTLQKEIL